MSADSFPAGDSALVGRLFQAGQDDIVSSDTVTDILLEALKSGRPVTDVIADRDVLSRRQREAIQELLNPSMQLADESQQTVGPGSVASRSEPSRASSPLGVPSPKKHSASSDQFPVGFERFESKSELGRGGWGVVVRAHDQQLGRDVAVKQLGEAAKADPDVARRFLHEARVTGQLQHPGIVPVYERGLSPESGQPFYAMKLLEGVTLRELMMEYHSCKKPAEKRARFHRLLSCLVDVCRAVGYAHSQRIIHRDLKPANIVCGDFGETVVVDWGLARILDDEKTEQRSLEETVIAGTPMIGSVRPSPDSLFDPVKTQQGSVIGTPAYMSPEQARGATADIGIPSDTYALGVILYVMLTGKPPFHAEDIQTTLKRVVEGRYEHPKAINRSVPSGLAAICVKAMARQPADRYQNGNEIAEELSRFLSSEKVEAHVETHFERAVRGCRRRPTLATAIFLGVTIVMVCSTVTAVAINRAHQQERLAKEEALASHKAEQKARVQAQSAKESAVQRLDQSRVAADSWLIDLSGALERFPGMAPMRQELLQKASDHYQALHDSIQSSDKLSVSESLENEEQIEAARCLLRLADLDLLMGQSAAAEQRFHDAQNLLQPLRVSDVSLGQQKAREQYNCEIGLALCKLQNQSVSEDYTRVFHETTRKFQQLVVAEQQEDQQNAVARGLFVTARMFVALGLWDDGLSLFRDTLQQTEFLVTEFADTRHQHLQSSIRTEFINGLIASGLRTEALVQLELKIHHLSDRLNTSAQRPDLLEARALARMKRSGLLLEESQNWAAEKGYSAAVEDFSESWRLLYGDHFYSENLAIAEANLGQLALQSGQLERADEMLRDSIDQLTGLLQSEQADRATVSRLALCNTSLSDLLILQRHQGTEAHLHRSLQVFDFLRQQEQLTAAEHLACGRLMLNFGLMLVGQVSDNGKSQDDAALTEMEKAISYLNQQPLVAASSEAKSLIARGHLLRSEIYWQNGRQDDANFARNAALEELRVLAKSEASIDVSLNSSTCQLIRALASKLATPAELTEAQSLLQHLPRSTDSQADVAQMKAVVAYRIQDSDGLRLVENAIASRRFSQPVDMAIRGCFYAMQGDDVLASECLQIAQMALSKRPGDLDLGSWIAELKVVLAAFVPPSSTE